MESLYEAGKSKIPRWNETNGTPPPDGKANELFLPEGRRPSRPRAPQICE